MNAHLVLHLFVSSFIHCINSEAIGKTTISDYITSEWNLDLYSNLLEKLRHRGSTNGFQLDHFLDYATQANCSQELVRFWDASNNNTRATYLDSFGKVGAGILAGNIVYLGYYDECIDIGGTDYCLFPFETMFNNNSVIPFQLGMCFPSSCDAKDFYNLFLNDSNEVLYNAKTFIADENLMTRESNIKAPAETLPPVCPWRDLKWTSSSIIVLTVCLLLIAFVIMGTVIDLLFWFVKNIFPKLFPPAEDTAPYQCAI